MQALKKEIRLVIVLVVLSLPLFFLNIHNTHSAGGDDYALYIKEAKNIAEGKPFYQSNYVFNQYNDCYSPPHYPVGYPLLLAPVVKICGISILAFCYFNTIVAAVLLLSFFFFFRKYMSNVPAVCLAVIISYSGIMIGLKQAVVADTTCLLFVMLYLVFRQSARPGISTSIVLAVFASMAMLTRTQAILIPVAELLMLLVYILNAWNARQAISFKGIFSQQSLAIVITTVCITLLLGKVVFPTPSSASGFYVTFLGITLQKGVITIVRDNINFFLESIRTFFHYDTENSIRTAIVTIMESAGLMLCITGFVISITRKVSFHDVFFVLMCGLMLYYPIHDARYFLPAIAIVFLYSYIALQKILPVVFGIRPLYMGIGFCVVYLFAGLKYLRETRLSPINYVPERRDFQAFKYLQENVKPDELVVCARPRLVTLYTDRRCIIHAWQHSYAENKRVFDSMNAKYLLVAYGIVEDYYHEYLNNYQHPIDSTKIAEGYTLYKLR
jgi:hypothetical protein